MKRPPVPLLALVTGWLASASASAQEPAERAPGGSLALLERDPEGPVEHAWSICARFDRPLADGAAVTVRVEPAVGGEVFQSSLGPCISYPDLRPATRYRVSLAGPLVADDGTRFAGPTPITWTFETPRPRVELLPMPFVHIAADEPVEMWAERGVTLAELRRRIRVYARPIETPGEILPEHAAGRDPTSIAAAVRRQRRVPIETTLDPRGDGENYLLHARDGWPLDARITVVASAGVRSTTGPLPSLHPTVLEFETVAVQRVLAESCVDRSACTVEPLMILLRYGRDEADLAGITVEPRPDHLEIQRDGSDALVFTGAFVPDTTYTISIPHPRGAIVRRYTFRRSIAAR